MAFTVKSFDQIVSDMVAYIVANSSKITDLSPGSVIRSFCEGAALSLEELYVATYLGFRRYLNDIPSAIFDFDRKSGTKASTNVVFSRTGTTGTVTIPSGTRLKTSSGLRFILDSDTDITAGNTDSDPSSVTSEAVGSTYNVSSGSITVIEDPVAGVDSVTNPNAATGGVDSETDFQYSKRFQAYIEGLGRSNLAGLISGALSVEGITSATIVENFPPIAGSSISSGSATSADAGGQTLVDTSATFITSGVKKGHAVVNFTDQSLGTVQSVDSETQLTMSALADGTDNQWEIGDNYKIYNKNINAYLYIDDGSAGGVSQDKVDEVDTVITGDGTEDNPGYRAAGVNVVVAAPSTITQNIDVTITPLSGVSQSEVEIDVNAALTSYVNTLGVGDDIIYNELITSVMGVYGVVDCDVTTPSSTVAISSSQVGRVGTITVTFV